MDVLIVGSSGRDHALAWALRQSPKLTRLFVAPGNAGTASIAENLAIAANDMDGLARLARDRKVDLVLVGPEDALIRGLADRITESGIPVFGPSAAAAATVVRHHFIRPSPNSPSLKDDPNSECVTTLSVGEHGVGRVVARSKDDVRSALAQWSLAQAPVNVRSEERLNGIDVSGHILTDGLTIITTPLCLDYYRLSEGGLGPMTAGMGAVVPVTGEEAEIASRAHEEAMRSVMFDLASRGHRYVGVLGTRLRIAANGTASVQLLSPTFGDPQAQTLLPLLESDLLGLIWEAVHHRLQQHVAKWSNQASVSVVLTAEGYPGDTAIGLPIHGSEMASEFARVFHTGTKRDHTGRPITSSGRVLTVVGVGRTAEEARAALDGHL